MHIYLDCFPCIIKQTLATARFVTNDEEQQEKILRIMLKKTEQLDLNDYSPKMGWFIQKAAQEITGIQDPYSKVKKDFNQFALQLLPKMQEKVRLAKDPFEMAIRLSIAGNIIDFGAKETVEFAHVLKAIDDSLLDPIDLETVRALQERVLEANDILILGDNCGEIVFDQLLIEQLPKEKITYAVKGGPILNDVTMEDAVSTGLSSLVNVIDNGLDAPGTLLDLCSPAFQKRFYEADCIISKGQANYETLSDVPADIFFLLKIKCPVTANHIGIPYNQIAIKRSNYAKN